ncbi:fibronectin type III domain-containing protein [Domibacillus mangrovi]|uniref:Fibronectin type-III domain-containing protein n=1 Tax=Domibacillus mangrovi TaxID=1714354 RepID=A0A1Q5P407_9BACI|nr:fibronectin type III domain-containing protein [Domibacillus mangrovi]OKL36985.1 hypothetical protein BLL40_05180 [Domibacillus mangrovi]
MAYLRTPDVGGIGETYLDIIVQDLQYNPSLYYQIDVICIETGQRFDVRNNSGSGGSIGAFRTGQQRFSGLTPGSAYNFYAEARYNSFGTIVRIPSTGYYRQTTHSLPAVDPPSSVMLSQYALTGKDITIEAEWLNQATSIEYDVSWITGYPDYTYSVSPYTDFHRMTFTVPNYDTSYWIEVRLRGNGGDSSWVRLYFTSGSAPIIVGTPSVTLSDFKNNAITANWTYASNAWYYEVQYKKTTSSIWLYSAYSQNDNSHEVTGLEPVTDYHFRVRGYQGSTFGPWSSVVTGRTLSNAPSKFEWNTLKTSVDFKTTAYEWNALMAKINQVRVYKGWSSYGFDIVVGDGIAYAYQFNDARSKIADMSPPVTLPIAVSKGTLITPGQLNGLRDSLNSLI